jgi:hypothetical protein
LDPRGEYQKRLAERQAEVARLEQRDALVGHARALVFLLGVVLGWLAWGRHAVSGAWVGVAAALFTVLVIVHDRALSRRKRVERGVAHYRRGLDRLDGKWLGQGEPGDRFATTGDGPTHPYAADLDLFGRGSLFELVCTARTAAGEKALADYLRQPAAAPVVRARQAAVEELRPRLDLREQLDLVGEEVQREVERPDELPAWGERARVLNPRNWVLRGGAVLLGLVGAGLLGWWMVGAPAWPFLLLVVVESLIYRLLRDRLKHAGQAILQAERELHTLARVLGLLERQPVSAPRLAELQQALAGSASKAIARLSQLANLLVSQKNQFFAPFAYLFMMPVHLAFAVEGWRARHGRDIQKWLAAAGELEALAALGGYAFEHPGDPFAEIVPEGALVEAEGLSHPLLGSAVPNALQLGGEIRVLLVSGSNMSGKSTLLRTVGTNLVLALAGAPVRATKLRISPMQIGATLRIQDSLQEGASRFYSEIRRLRQIVDLTAGPLPVLFLLDEILAGTNSHDRRIGAEGVVRGLVERGAVGLCTTHDLALAEMQIPGAVNVHFEDHLEAGELRFDYKMRPGVVRKSNALELMRAVGLKV